MKKLIILIIVLLTSTSYADTVDETCFGNLTVNGTATGAILVATNYATAPVATIGSINLTKTSNQIVLQSEGITTTLTDSGASTNKTITFPNFTGTLYISGGTDVAVADGGTNLSSYAVGDLIYASDTTTLAKLADVAVASYLRSGGVNTAPLWSTLKLPNSATQYDIVLATSTNTYGEDGGLVYNTSTDILGVSGQVRPTSTSQAQLQPQYSAAIYTTQQVEADGDYTSTNVGGSTGNFNYNPTGTGDPVISSGTGILGQGGKGNTNNERLYWDYESTSNVVSISSTTGVTGCILQAIGLTAPNFTDTALTSGRVVIAGASGLLSNDLDLTFSGDTLTATHINQSTYHADGVHHSEGATYISGTGTAGTDNTAQTVKTISLPANSLIAVGDRVRIRVLWTGDTGNPITGITKLNGVTIASTTDGGTATFQVCEAWLHYIDSTHANIISMLNGAIDTSITAANVASFAWTSSQDFILTQDMQVNNHIIVYAMIVDVFPKGV